MNKLIFLGTGNAANLERQMTSLLFTIGNNSFLVDYGQITLAQDLMSIPF